MVGRPGAPSRLEDFPSRNGHPARWSTPTAASAPRGSACQNAARARVGGKIELYLSLQGTRADEDDTGLADDGGGVLRVRTEIPGLAPMEAIALLRWAPS